MGILQRTRSAIRRQAQWSDILWFDGARRGLLPWAFSFSGEDPVWFSTTGPTAGILQVALHSPCHQLLHVSSDQLFKLISLFSTLPLYLN
ncbi:hypothetical protein AMECASPLE_019979 [Ameca splendens]|uniref:Uncharacterized protein n=1 Tax=Ameca splendens TaxID=208324 RepID=A0ABV0XS94_9TELE